MNPDKPEREQALEDRLARVEAQLRRLEGAMGIESEAGALDPAAPTPGGPATPASPPTPAGAPTPASPPTAPTPAPPPEPAAPAWLPANPMPAPLPDRMQAPPGSMCGRCRKHLSPIWRGSCRHCGAAYAEFPPVPWEPVERASEPRASAGIPSAPRPSPGLSSIMLPDLSGSLDDLEARLAGRALAWVGGLALVLGAIFFLSLAFSRGWIGPELRVLLGLVAGSVGLAGGAAFMERGNRLLGHVLTPLGLAIISISLVAATRLYGLVPVEIGLLGALASAIAAAAIAVRANSQIVAAFGLVAVLAAPPLMGAAPDMMTLAFIAVALVGTTGVALWRSWSWLPPVAFVLSAPQAAAWVSGHPESAIGLAGIGLFWLLNIVVAGGEEFRRHRDDLSPSSATLLLANVAFLIWAGFVLLSGDLAAYRGLFLVLVALAHLGIGGVFVVRDGERNLFGLLAMGTGIAALTMAAPIQLGASAVPVAWSAEAVALAWVAVRRGHPYSAVVSGILYALAGGFLVALYRMPIASTSGIPFVDGPGASLGFFVAAVAVGVWIVRDRSLRSGLAAFGLVVAADCVPAALDDPATVIAMSILMVLGTAAWRVIPILPGAPIRWQVEGLIPRALQRIGEWRRPTDALLPLATALVGVLATVRLVADVYGPTAGALPTGIPFVDPSGAALAVYLVGLFSVAWISGRSRLREPLAAIALLVTARACVTEFDGVALVAAWSILMVIGYALWRELARLPHRAPTTLLRWRMARFTLDLTLPIAATLAGVLAALHTLAIELPISRFGDVLPPAIPFTDDGATAAFVLAVTVLASGFVVGDARARRVSILVAGGILAYAIPFEVYAWAVAVLWAGLGMLGMGLARVDPAGRRPFIIGAAGMVVGAAIVAVGIVAPPSRLVVGQTAIDAVVALQTIAALGAVALALVALARSGGRSETWPRWTWIAAGVTIVYALSVAVVDLVAMQIGGSVATDELRTQGQVALSVSWAALGVAAFVAGLRLRIDDLRRGGFALLALATAKVFLFDLSALDVAYRVISLIALGLLLLVSAWLWQRSQPRTA
jgi:uncharacterized membrane protein